MSTNLSAKGQKVYEFFRKNPNASASATAAKHKMSISNVYKMRARALNDLRHFSPPKMLPMPGVIPGSTTSSWREIVKEIAETAQTTSVDKTLDARAEMYGKFKDGAALMQSIKRTLADHAAKHGKTFADDQWEALEMIVHKIGRIVNGDPDVTDHWVDIAGYATLIAERLEGNAR
jgi:hypothetical protein